MTDLASYMINDMGGYNPQHVSDVWTRTPMDLGRDAIHQSDALDYLVPGGGMAGILKAGAVIPMSAASGVRAAALRSQQMKEALGLIRAHPEKFMAGEGRGVVDQLERAAQRYSFSPPIKPPAQQPASVLPFQSKGGQ